MGVRSPGESDQYLVYLVTNRHVVEGHQELQLRVNPAALGAAREYSLDLGAAIRHPNPEVDVAAVPVNMNLLQAEGMQVAFFADAQHCAPVARLQSEGVAEGDSVFLLGYPMGLIGGVGAAALVRSGTIARLRDVFASPSSPFLIDGSVYPGNSGGPVVSKPELASVSGTTAVGSSYLIGIVASYTAYQDVAVSQQTGRPRVIFEENSGIAQVFTVDMIAETVEIHASRQPHGQGEATSQVDVEEMEQAGQDRSEGSTDI
jgi:S1-C subfamily serine protease